MEEVQNIPELRFSEFEGEWEEKKLFQISKINPKNGGLPKEFIYIDLESVEKGVLVKEEIIEAKYAPSRAQRLLINNDILFQTVRPYQKNNFFFTRGDNYVASTGYAQIRTENNAKYLYQFLHTEKFVKKVIFSCTGTSYPAINSSDLAKIDIKYPTLPEQQKIATFLTAVDDKIQQLTKKKELLEQYNKSVMQKIFSRKIRFKDDNDNEFPDWKEKKLGELTFKVGKKNKDNIKYPIYSINNKEGFLPQADQFEGMDSNNRGYDISLYKIIYKRTFAYNPARINVGSIGFSGELNNIIISSLYVCFQTNKSLEDKFLSLFINTYSFNKSVLRNVEGGVRNYLFYDNFSNIKIPLPSIHEQQKITNFLTSIDKKIESVNTQLEKSKAFKKGLLQKMFV